VDSIVRRIDQMEGSQITRGRGRPRKTIRETIKKDLEINGLEKDMVFDRTNTTALLFDLCSRPHLVGRDLVVVVKISFIASIV